MANNTAETVQDTSAPVLAKIEGGKKRRKVDPNEVLKLVEKGLLIIAGVLTCFSLYILSVAYSL